MKLDAGDVLALVIVAIATSPLWLWALWALTGWPPDYACSNC